MRTHDRSNILFSMGKLKFAQLSIFIRAPFSVLRATFCVLRAACKYGLAFKGPFSTWSKGPRRATSQTPE